MSSIMRARSAVTGRGEGWDIEGSSLRAEGCWTFNAQDRMPRSSPLTAHPLTANAKNAPAPTPPSRESGFVLGWFWVIPELPRLLCPSLESGHLLPKAATPDAALISTLPLVG